MQKSVQETFDVIVDKIYNVKDHVPEPVQDVILWLSKLLTMSKRTWKN